MLRLYDIQRIAKTAKRLSYNFGERTFTRKEFEKVHRQYDIFCLQTMLDYGFLKVGHVEYFDIDTEKNMSNYYAKKDNLRIRVDENDLATFVKYGFLSERVLEKVKGKRYFYYVDYDKMREELNYSKQLYLNDQYERLEERKDKIARRERQLDKLKEELTLGVF